jgi:hypothetical protein
MYAGSFKIYMEQRAVICFLTLKGLKARVIHADHESIYGPEALNRQ